MFLAYEQFLVWPVAVDIETKGIVGRAAIFALKSVVEGRFESIKFGAGIAGNKLIVDMHGDEEDCGSDSFKVQAWVGFS